jgi:acyl-CoA synthetase (AMP-forming)/AMP-acid ligase II
MTTDSGGPSTLPAVLHHNYATAPERPAVYLLSSRQPDRAMSFRALMHGAAGYARAFAAAGVEPGEVLVLILQHGEDLIFAFWGAVLAGAIPSIMPFLTEKLAPEKYRQELAALVEITRPAAVVTSSAFAPEVHAAIRTGPRVSLPVVFTSEAVGAQAIPDLTALPGVLRSPDDLVLLQHSSGTTGLQKGVALSHRAVLNQLNCYAAAINMSPDDVVVSWLPLYHDMGLIAGFVMPILRQVPLVLMSPFDWVRAPYRLLQATTRYHGTLTWLPNFAFNFCTQKIRDRDLAGVDLSSWRAVINCSEPMRWESQQAFVQRFAAHGLRPAAMATCYAMAENVFAVTQGGIDGPLVVDAIDRRALIAEQAVRPAEAASAPQAVNMLSAGRPLPNVRLRVLDERRHELPERRVGEIALRSDCMLAGYYNRADLTAQAFHDGWYLTGDLGYLAEGELFVTGRKKDLIIVGGKNVHPQDLEALAGEVPGVHPGRVVAFGVFDEELGTEEVVVVAEVDSDADDERRRLADEIRQCINRGSDIAVRVVQIVGPRWVLKTSSGKLARAANREKYLAEF